LPLKLTMKRDFDANQKQKHQYYLKQLVHSIKCPPPLVICKNMSKFVNKTPSMNSQAIFTNKISEKSKILLKKFSKENQRLSILNSKKSTLLESDSLIISQDKYSPNNKNIARSLKLTVPIESYELNKNSNSENNLNLSFDNLYKSKSQKTDVISLIPLSNIQETDNFFRFNCLTLNDSFSSESSQ